MGTVADQIVSKDTNKATEEQKKVSKNQDGVKTNKHNNLAETKRPVDAESNTKTKNLTKNNTKETKESKKDKVEAKLDGSANIQNNLNLSSSNGVQVPGQKGEESPAKFSPLCRQALTATAAILMSFATALTSGYSAILLPQLAKPGSIVRLDETTASWIAAMAVLPMAPGCLISGWIMEKFGRKTSLYILCIPLLLGWILITVAGGLFLLLAGRFFTGMSIGLVGPLGPVFIAETTEPRYRGFFIAGLALAFATGILVSHVLGTFLSWRWTAAISCVFPVLSALLLTLVPESPTWLIGKRRHEDGVKSFFWLRGYGEDAKTELKGLIDKQKAAESEPRISWKQKLKILKSPILLKPLFIMITFFIVAQFSGMNAVVFYSISIVEKAVGKGNVDHYVAMLVIDTLRVMMSVVACVVCKKYGRRPLCFISGTWIAISMIGLSMYLYLTGGTSTMAWLPLLCLLIYIAAVSIGFVPLPWMMCGEIFPTRVRGLGSGVSSAVTFTAFFVVVKTAPAMMTNLGDVLTFYIYGMNSFVGTIVLYFILPETKGKSLQEIEERFKNEKIFKRCTKVIR